jgi:hypothetical protein
MPASFVQVSFRDGAANDVGPCEGNGPDRGGHLGGAIGTAALGWGAEVTDTLSAI